MLDVHYPATRCYQYVCLCVRVYTIYVRVCVLHITIYYTCTSNFHLWHTSVFCSNIQKYQFFGTQNSLETNHPPDHQTTNIDCPPTMKKKEPRLLLLGDSPVTAWPGSLRRLLSLRAASAPAPDPPFPASLGQGAEPDTVANALLRPGWKRLVLGFCLRVFQVLIVG